MQSGFAFSGNPVIFSEPAQPNKEVTGGRFDLWRGPEIIYSCKFSLPLYSLNLAEVIDGELAPIPLPDFKEGEWISLASDFISRTIYILGEYDNGAECESGDIVMLRGRIPSALYRQLTAAGKDIFIERFFESGSEFLPYHAHIRRYHRDSRNGDISVMLHYTERRGDNCHHLLRESPLRRIV